MTCESSQIVSRGKDLDFADDPIPLIPSISINPKFKAIQSISEMFDDCNEDNDSSIFIKISCLNLQKPKHFKEQILFRLRNKTPQHFESDRHNHSPLIPKEKYKNYDKIKMKIRDYNMDSNQSVRSIGLKGSQKMISSNFSQNNHAYDEVISQSQKNSIISNLQQQSKKQQKQLQISQIKTSIQVDQKNTRQNKYLSKNLSCFAKSKSILKRDSSLSYIQSSKERSPQLQSKKEVRFGLTKKQIRNLSRVTKC